MQPDPAIFLRGLRREVLRYVDTGFDNADATYPLTLRRVGETLVHLIVQRERLPAILDEIWDQQRDLFAKMRSALEAAGREVPPEPAADSDPIARHDAMLRAMSACLAGMFVDPALQEKAAALGLAASDIEQQVRDRIADARQEIIDADARKVATIPGEDVMMAEQATDYLRGRFPDHPHIAVDAIRRQPGVNTKEILFLTLSGRSDWPREAVMRRNRPFDTVGNSVADEYELLQELFDAGFPVPRPLLADSTGGTLGRSLLLTERVPGRAQAPDALGADARPVVEEMGRLLAKLHRIDSASVHTRDYGATVRDRTIAMVDRFYALRAGDENQGSVTLEYAFQWLRLHAGDLSDATTIVHGDYNLRNILVAGGHITAILDWELAHRGHPAEDLAYCRPQVETVMEWRDFLQLYHDHGGPPVTDADILYFEIYAEAFRSATIFPASNYYCIGKHGDFLIGGAGFIEYAENQAFLAKALHRTQR